MSDSMGSSSPGGGAGSSAPRAIIHKRILDVAEANPDASMQHLADEVTGASVDLVEKVLEEYGDPASGEQSGSEAAATDDESESIADESDAETDESDAEANEPADGGPAPAESASDTEDDSTGAEPESAAAADEVTGAAAAADGPEPVTDPEELTTKQRETFRLIHERPAAPQQEIADALGVTRATVSRRVNDVDGFDWSDRRAFVDSLFDGEPGASLPVDDRPAESESGTVRADGPAASSDGGVRRDADGDLDRNADGDSGSDAATDDGPAVEVSNAERADAVAELAARVSQLEDALSNESGANESGVSESGTNEAGAFTDPDLAHKVVHACIDAEYVSEDEELRIIKAILGDE